MEMHEQFSEQRRERERGGDLIYEIWATGKAADTFATISVPVMNGCVCGDGGLLGE